MTEKNDPVARALEAVKKVNAGAENVVLSFVHTGFLNGKLYVVRFKQGNREELENYVYIAGAQIEVAKSTSHLVDLVTRKGRHATAFQLLLEFGGIAGVIAIVITLTICYIYIFKTGGAVPPVLSTALTTILGF